MVHGTRLDSAISSAALMRQALVQVSIQRITQIKFLTRSVRIHIQSHSFFLSRPHGTQDIEEFSVDH